MNELAVSRFALSLFALSLFVLAGAALTGCEPIDLIDNPRADHWCGDRPCFWDVKGKVDRVGTWNKYDYAVSMLGSASELTQVNATVNSSSVDCLEFGAIFDIEGDAHVFLELDFLNDGKVDFSQEMPASKYKPLYFLITPPTWYEGVRFIIRKQGSGKAILAKLRAQPSTSCKRPAVPLADRPDGVSCEQDSECKGGTCLRELCMGCSRDSDCTGDQICGTSFTRGVAINECQKQAGHVFGDRCRDDRECDTGICCNEICSSCCSGDDCKSGQSCAFSLGDGLDAASAQVLGLPKQCAPQQHESKAGELCTDATDCMSGACDDFYEDCESGGCFGTAEADGGCDGACVALHLHAGTCE